MAMTTRVVLFLDKVIFKVIFQHDDLSRATAAGIAQPLSDPSNAAIPPLPCHNCKQMHAFYPLFLLPFASNRSLS